LRIVDYTHYYDIEFLRYFIKEHFKQIPEHISDICITEHTKKEASITREKQRLAISINHPSRLIRVLYLVDYYLETNQDIGRLTLPVLHHKLGVMIDCSRNAVPTVQTLKDFLQRIAVLGYTTLYLYMEDTYKLDAYPYFGYMRGSFSQEELKEIDAFAALLAIEVVPCIQTLAHLTNALQWPYAQQIKDTDDILLVGEDATYHLIEEMIRTMVSCFRTNRIHIGFDEAHLLGLGRYLQKNG